MLKVTEKSSYASDELMCFLEHLPLHHAGVIFRLAALFDLRLGARARVVTWAVDVPYTEVESLLFVEENGLPRGHAIHFHLSYLRSRECRYRTQPVSESKSINISWISSIKTTPA